MEQNKVSKPNYEQFYVMTFTLGGEYLESQPFANREDAARYAGMSSRLPLVAEIYDHHSGPPIETWVGGSYFRYHEYALDYAAYLLKGRSAAA
jgi:hypothetical protein